MGRLAVREPLENDIHMGLHTVREALDFSAHIRLPASIGKAQRDAWVTEVIALVGLGSISDRVIGDAATPGLAPGQMKLVTIAVELVANPSVLFLDEPTSGLDAPSAFRIMTAVKRISQTGRSVLCTIHQPSSELFFMFDRLLLLRSGGEEVFFSDIGPQGRALVDYFEHRSAGVVKHPPRLPLGQNPANWMLDVIGSGVHSDEGGAIAALDYEAADWHQLWKTSELQKQVYAELGRVSATENTGGDFGSTAGSWEEPTGAVLCASTPNVLPSMSACRPAQRIMRCAAARYISAPSPSSLIHCLWSTHGRCLVSQGKKHKPRQFPITLRFTA